MTAGFRRSVARARFEKIAAIYDGTVLRRREAYNDGVDKIVSAHVQRLATRSYSSPLFLLDAACGTGSRWSGLVELLPDSRACGVDLSHSMCAEAHRSGGFACVTRAPLTRLPFADNSFDVVTCLFFSFCYLTSRRERLQALAEMRRVLQPGGFIFIDVINRWHCGEGLEYHRSWSSLVLDALLSVGDPRLSFGDKLYWTQHDFGRLRGYFHGFSVRSFSRLLKGAGLQRHELLTIGYNSGQVVADHRAGQILACIMDAGLY
jgi:ubiquinone/menaquinone biosynthesis C-methylase UbiE